MDGNKTKIIRHICGNWIQMSIPLSERVVTVTDGSETSVDHVSRPRGPVYVELCFGTRKIRKEAIVAGNMATITDNGTLPVGSYSISVLYRDELGHPMRYKKRTILNVVDTTAEGGRYETDEMNVIAHYPVVGGESGIIDEDGYITFRVGRHFQEDQDTEDNYADAGTGYGAGTVTVEEDTVTFHI